MTQQPPTKAPDTPAVSASVTTSASPVAAPRKLPIWRRWHWYKLPLFGLSIFLFILAITLMKDGAKGLGPLVRDSLQVTNFVDAMGFGWLFSYAIMSGSPVAATALAFFDAGAVDQFGAYGMIVGSRLGASFIVLFIGFIYVLRGRNRSTSLSMGLLSLSVAGSLQLLALGVGLAMLEWRIFDSFQPTAGGGLTGLTDLILDPISHWLQTFLPGWALFVIGLAIIMVSFNLFDRCLPEMTLKESGVSAVSQMVYKPWVMFLLGSAVTLISMSVSISLGLLVPLSQRGLVRRENVIPYIMGANISTFIDTAIAALLLGNPTAFSVVMVEMASLFVVAAIILAVSYTTYERTLLRFVNWVSSNNRNLGAFMLTIFVVPIILIFF